MVVIDDLQLQPGVASTSSQHRPGLLRSGVGTQAPFPVCPGKGGNANPQKGSEG
jgi:hypothetical protein